MNYLLRRLGFYLLAAWISLTLSFFIPRFAPGDPLDAILIRFQGGLEPSALQALAGILGDPDRPLLVQYWEYLLQLSRGELGVSLTYFPAPVSGVIAEGLLWTLLLAGMAVALSFAVGTLLGVLAAWKRGGAVDSFLAPAFILIGAFPYFWLAMLLLFVLGFRLDWFPIRHAYDDHLSAGWTLSFAASVLRHAALPCATIVLTSLGGWMLGMRNTMIGVLSEDYIAMAQAKGLSSRRVMLRYAARSAILPNVTGFGMALGFVLSGSLLTEIVFSYPGQGYLLFQAVKNQDYALMQGLFLTITLAVLGANWLVDVAYIFLDPRTRGS